MADKHIGKLLVESMQMLSTAHRVLDGELYYGKTSNGRSIKRWRLENDELENTLYKATHVNHPCNVWLRESISNYNWLVKHAIALSNEFEIRYLKWHKSSNLISLVYYNEPRHIPNVPMTWPALAMPDKYKTNNVVESYRDYYRHDKKHLLQYTYRDMPKWLQE